MTILRLGNSSGSFAPVAEAMHEATRSNVRLGAELALPRLRTELNEVDRIIGVETVFKVGIPALVGGILGVLLIAVGNSTSSAFIVMGVIFIAIGLSGSLWLMTKSAGTYSRTEMRKAEIEAQIREAERILNS